MLRLIKNIKMKVPTSRNDQNSRIPLEQVRLIYRNYPFMLGMNFSMSLLVGISIWRHLPHLPLMCWLLANLALSINSVINYFRQRRLLNSATPDSDAGVNALRLCLITALMRGSMWGLVGMSSFVFPMGSMQDIIFIAIIGQAFGGSAFLAVDIKIFYAYLLTMLIPTLLAYAIVPGETHLPLAWYTLALFVATSALAHNIHAMIMHSLALRFENMDLINALTAQKTAANEANVSKSRFLAAASHDLRQPVHALGLFIGALSSRVQEIESRKILANISATLETLEGMFNALLDVSKLDAGVLEPKIQDFPLTLLLTKIHTEFLLEAKKKNLRFSIISTRLAARSDIALLERMLRNLVSNAIRYTTTGGVVVGCRRIGDKIRIEVWDTGIGIAPTRHKEIFQEFYQVDNPERNHTKGVGLGLAIVQRLSRLLQHPVSLRSIYGKGSVFMIELPAGNPQAALPSNVPPIEPAIDKLHGLQVALVDDDPMVIKSMRALLTNWGCLLQHAEDGDTLIAQLMFSGSIPHVVISDYRLCGSETGVDVIRKVERLAARPVGGILITGDTAPDRLKESIASGYYLLHKPVRPAKLRALLTHLAAQISLEPAVSGD